MKLPDITAEASLGRMSGPIRHCASQTSRRIAATLYPSIASASRMAVSHVATAITDGAIAVTSGHASICSESSCRFINRILMKTRIHNRE